MSKVDYAKIREENIKNYGTKTHHLAYFADIYSTRTHFIFEVLQNAEDALARRLLSSPSGYVRFHLYFDRLEIYHNGKPFDDRDIVGICGIGEGTKAGDYTQIGKFGIGFKSVYAYSFFPQIHSEDEHFEIRRFVEPYEIAAKSSEDTLILLPFDQPDKRPEWAFRKNVNTDVAQSEISRAITKLNFRTLLFLGNVEKIEWILASGEQGFLTTENKLENKQNNWRIVEVSDHQGKREQWHIFARTITVIDEDKEEQVTVEVAFLMDKNGEVIKASDTELVVSFPTEKKTELGFLIQAPFKATKSRDNIKRDDPANHKMIQTAAQLTADSLSVLRDTNRLAVTSYSALPLDEDDFPEDNFFRPVYDRVREALKTQSLLPAHCGGFIKADEAKLARGKDLVDLFSSEQLGKLFDKEKLAWLDASITIDSFADFHGYLLDLVDGIQVTPDSLVPKLTDDFLSNQSVAWLIQLIQYAEQRPNVLKRAPFVRLQSGKQVALPENKTVSSSAWFAPKETEEIDLSVFPLVHAELAENASVRSFLVKEGIHEIGAAAIIAKSILPKFQGKEIFVEEFDQSTYRNDLRMILDAYVNADSSTKTQLTNNLNNVPWLASTHASGTSQNKIVWKKPGAKDLFEKTPEHEIWFRGLDKVNAYFLHPSANEELERVITALVKPVRTLVAKNPSGHHIKIASGYGWHKRGLYGFDPDWDITGFDQVCSSDASKCLERSKLLWMFLNQNYQCIKGIIETSTRKTFEGSTNKEITSHIGQRLSELTWLPDKGGNWHNPSDLFLTDLPDGFETSSVSAREVAEKLGMKKPEVEQAINVVAGNDPNKIKRIERFLSASDAEQEKMLTIIPQSIPPQPAPSFKEGFNNLNRSQRGSTTPRNTDNSSYPLNNPERYQNTVNQTVEENINIHQTTPLTIRFAPVRELPSNKHTRDFLYEQYQGKCQITGDTFPKASANTNGEAENYFEASSLLSYSNADYLNDAGNMLCVSADTMAKLKNASFEWLDEIEPIIEHFKKREKGEIENIKAKIQLAGEECVITWSERHFAHLVALWDNAS